MVVVYAPIWTAVGTCRVSVSVSVGVSASASVSVSASVGVSVSVSVSVSVRGGRCADGVGVHACECPSCFCEVV